ncbi:hypothetical protein [Streptosporangium sp. NPDC001681]|uniref:hypothetical protein n=1 Tax=Streptosporangium sp. NPDC001681 TaxID=3154395 RepID=UPI00332F53BD
MTFQDHMQRAATKTLSSIPAADAPDIYAISFYIHDEDDDPQRPTLTIGYNTESQVRQVTDPSGRYPDPAEARWNYAYWLQNELVVIADTNLDPEGSIQRDQWIIELPQSAQRHNHVTARFVEVCIQLAKDLQASGLIQRAVGRRVPVLIHELEYYELLRVPRRPEVDLAQCCPQSPCLTPLTSGLEGEGYRSPCCQLGKALTHLIAELGNADLRGKGPSIHGFP